MRRVLIACLLALVIGASSAVPAVAQDAPNGLTTALGSVPDTLDVRQQLVSWIDYRALIGSREGAAHPASIEALLAQLDAKDPAARLWMAALNGAASGSGRLLRYLLNGGPQWPRIVGFDFTDVRSELAFGQPPGDGIVLQGDFDPARIGAALSARDFTSTDAGPFTLWCRSDGCDKGLELDIADRDPADPFGGELGRRQPLAVSERHAALVGGHRHRRWDARRDRRCRAVARGRRQLRRGRRGAGRGGDASSRRRSSRARSCCSTRSRSSARTPPPTRSGNDWPTLAADFEPIPPASLLGIGDAATDSEQVVTLALAYPTLAEAQTAADVLPRRLDTMTSLRTARPWKELLDERGVGTIDARAVEREDGEGALALLTFRAPLAGPEADPDTGLVTASSMLYRLFAQMIQARDTALAGAVTAAAELTTARLRDGPWRALRAHWQ